VPPSSRNESDARGQTSRRARVVVVGAGFAGGSLLRNLPPPLRRHGETLLVDRSDTYEFIPLIHEVAVGRIHPDSVTSPIAPLCEDRAGFLQATVTGVDVEEKLLYTDRGAVGYEYLVLSGGSDAARPPDGLEDRFQGFRTVADALRLRGTLNAAWRRATMPGTGRPDSLTVVIVGGGATGVELAAETAVLFDYLEKRTPRRPSVRPRVVLLERTGRLLGWLDSYFHDVALEELARLGVEVRLNSPVEEASDGGVRVGDEDLPAGIMVWTTGISIPETIRSLPGEHDPSGRVVVTSHLTLPDHPEVYVLGDAAAYEHPRRGPLPPTASVAVQQGPWTARDLARRLNGTPVDGRPAFSLFDRGYAVSLGPESAVADPLGVRLRGVPAQALYRGVLLFFQRSRRGRTLTAADWAMERTIGRVGFDSVLPDASSRTA
jgi:NADH:ubiquinone reductase (H+-translocating)